MDDKYKKIYEQREILHSEKVQVQNEEFKRSVIRDLKKDIMTLGIGTIAEIEEVFGDLWGHGKPLASLDEVEREWREEWDNLRTVLLDKINEKIRRIEQGFKSCDVTRKKFTILGRMRNGN